MKNGLAEQTYLITDVFNIEEDQSWKINPEQIEFGKKKWKEYIDRKVLEITCGEAPFIVSRYNASTGEIIPVEDWVGILDRKLRVVNENTTTEKEWCLGVLKAYKSVYGYEYQGDNLLGKRQFIDILN